MTTDLENVRRTVARALAHLHAALDDPAPHKLARAIEATETLGREVTWYERAAQRDRARKGVLVEQLAQLMQPVGNLLHALERARTAAR